LGDPKSDFAKRQKLSWQERALSYIDLIPELSYASNFYARMLNQLRIFPAILDDEGTPQPVEDERAIEILQRIHDPGGGISQILSNYGRLMMITGEGTLFGRELETADEVWSFVWNDELEVTRNSDQSVKFVVWKPDATQTGTKYAWDTQGGAIGYRMWTPHPRRSGEATSPMRSVLQIAEEMLTLTDSVMATATSRKTEGILCLPQNLSPGPIAAEGDEDPKQDPFMEDLTNHLVAQVENAGSPEAAAPFVLWGDGELIQQAKMLWMHDRQNDFAEIGLRAEARDRMALGMDMPPEALKGLGDSNHWAAKQIKEDMWASHGVGKASQFCTDLCASYYRPALRAEGVTDAEKIIIAYNDDQVVSLTDRSEDADAAIKVEAIGHRGYRKWKGIPESLAPSAEEKIALQEMRQKGPSQNGSGPDGDPSDGPPPPGPEGDSGRQTRVVGSSVKELGAAEMALSRCRELAGYRIRAKEKTCPDCVAAANGKPLVLVASAVGPMSLKQMNLVPRELVRGGSDALRPLLRSWDYTETQADSVCEMIEIWAAKTLLDERSSLPAAAEAQIQLLRELAAA
jgi:hypothetical protein